MIKIWYHINNIHMHRVLARKNKQEAETVKQLQRFFCALLALTLLFPMAATAAETEEAIIEDEIHLIMATEELRSQWTPSNAIVKFIANQEGFRSTAHKSGSGWYIGYGTQIKAGQYPNGISREKALELLAGHITDYAAYLDSFLQKNDILVTRYEYDALLSLTHNLSTKWMSGTLSSYLKAGVENYSDVQVVNAFGSYCRAGGKVLAGLALRRIQEAKIFLYGDYGDFNYDYWYAPSEKELQLQEMKNGYAEMESLLAGGVDAEGAPLAENVIMDTTAAMEALAAEMETLAAEIEWENSLKLIGTYYGGAVKEYTYVCFDGGKGVSDKYIMYFEKGAPYGEFSAAQRSGYQLAGWESDDGKLLRPTDYPTKAVAVKAVWTKGTVDHRNLSLSPFADVPMSAWYYDELKELNDANIIGGYGDGKFRPNDALSCGAVLKLVLLSAGYSEQQPVDENALSGYLALALREGLVQAGEIADLKAPASRLMVAKLVAKSMELAPSDTQTPYADADDPYATALYDTGIMAGKVVDGVRVLDAKSDLRRCEAAAVIWRMRNHKVQEEIPVE